MARTEPDRRFDARRLLPIVLAIALLFPIAYGVTHGRDTNQQDMRALAERPSWTRLPIHKWASAYEAWLNDHYPFRSAVVRTNAVIRHRWLGEPSSAIVVGRDGWLFYGGNRTTDDLLGRDRLTNAELAGWQRALEARAAWWHERGAKYLFVIVPNKSTIYPEELPIIYQSQLRRGKLDQLLEYLQAERCAVPVLDLRPALLAQKRSETVYWRTDTHWNAAGLLVGCETIRHKLKEIGAVQSSADWKSQLQIDVAPREGDCIRVLRMRGAWPIEDASQLRVRASVDVRAVSTNLGPTGKPLAFERSSGTGRAVLLGDSFFRIGGLPSDALGDVPLLLDFQRFVTLWPWEGDRNRATSDLLTELAEKEKPTVVIEQWTERYLHTIPSTQ